MRLDEVADELYGAPPEEFVAVRTERVRQARAAGDRELATRLGKLRRPTQSAWLVNLLWRRRRRQVEELLALGEEFRGEELTRQRLQELSTRRRALLHQLQSDAQRLSEEAGVQLTADRAREVEATLAAALADPEAAEQVRAGRLVTPLSYSGLGPELHLALVPQPDDDEPDDDAGEESGEAETAGPATAADPADAEAEAEARAARERAAARRRALRLVTEHTQAWEIAVKRRDELLERRDELRAELRRVQNSLDRLERELATAERDVEIKAEDLEEVRRSAAD